MKFTTGSRIEVFSKRDVSSGSWRPAEIISGNGCNYMVKYDRRSADESVVGWVSQNAIRPSPPREVTNWFSGDVVEVFNRFSWKLATVQKGLGNKQVLVRLHGALEDLAVGLNDIRDRQLWEDNKWIMMGKRPLNSKEAQHNDAWACSSHGLKSSLLNRLTECEYPKGAAKKYRQVEKCGQMYRVMENHTPSGENGNDLPSHSKMVGKKRGRTSLIIRFPAAWQRKESNQRLDSSSAVSYSSDEDSDLCSVGSCSSSDSWGHINYAVADDSNGELSDAESSTTASYDERDRIKKSLEEAASERIHQLELHAYRFTLRALHASGPISWEQQSLISNLRFSLNISNDEHLMELKNLLSNDH